MSIGLPPPDVKQISTTPEFKAPNGFTPFSDDRLSEAQQTISKSPESGTVTTEPPKFKEPTTTDNPEMDKLLADILSQGKPKNPQEAVKQVEKNIPTETKKSWTAKIIEWFSNLPIIRWFFRKK